jgi:hypothetical protein
MTLTPKGAHAAQLGLQEKRSLAEQFMSGQADVLDYMNGVCYDAVAFVKYLLNPRISPDDLLDTAGSGWKRLFNFEMGWGEWDGVSAIPRGTAIGFKRLQGYTQDPDRFFHAALATGGARIRGINGLTLGNGWLWEVDLAQALRVRNGDGSF